MFLTANATRFLKRYFFLPMKSLKNHTQKYLRNPQIDFFSLMHLADQTARTEELVFQSIDQLYIKLGLVPINDLSL